LVADLSAQHPQLLIARSQRVVIFCSLDSVTLMDLLSVLPGFRTRPYAHIIPPLERNKITIVDLITLDNLEIAKRAHVPPADLRQLTTQVLKALHKDVGFEEACESDDAVEPSSSNDIEKPLIPGPSTKRTVYVLFAISDFARM
jgi:DNA repair protein RAD57